MRNPLCSTECVLKRAYIETADINPQIPCEPGIVPPLLEKVMPLHEVIPVDCYLPGCPPPADRIKALLTQLLTTGTAQLVGAQIKFG
jgi:NAD-reducing hydrogenase small subunit